ncbi:thiamin biosynthesis ThiGH complex subunit [uncultured Pleomorphomonas sp.]|uniref:Thiamin biosynthesis ThiGH complex subunit n=1 Tax=uncultured Pleomorphomonas sp. TaxID=442121 RepID=A0A212LEV5_9HYPH|nr:2-iminoacetate synthase ThiH [uncultured Pleomorphomonas sp.]SCM76092.1 thiamin biosynthesis ThiGH complex subunit [uncultured Pleomorphomonas sp.]
MSAHFVHAPYQDGMEVIDSGIMEGILDGVGRYDPAAPTERDVARALGADRLTPDDFAALLSPAARPFLEAMAVRARAERRRHFGTAVSLFTPLYLSNHCRNRCVYCGFNAANRIRRAQLDLDSIDRELAAIAATGLQDVLLLTGESRSMSGVAYIGEAVKLAARRFALVGIEVYPLNTDEYAYLNACGADYTCVFQETYDPVRYLEVHAAGPKRVYPYRLEAQERALRGGMRSVAFAALLGLADFRKDAFATGLHAHLIQRAYPWAEISFSLPRLRPHVSNAAENAGDVHETELLQVMLAYRLFMPHAAITISSRERAGFRDHAVDLCATRMSAGVRVDIGGHGEAEKGDGQFEIADGRDVGAVHAAIVGRGLQPVYRDYIRT